MIVQQSEVELIDQRGFPNSTSMICKLKRAVTAGHHITIEAPAGIEAFYVHDNFSNTYTQQEDKRFWKSRVLVSGMYTIYIVLSIPAEGKFKVYEESDD